jgi:hypothetical protein
MLENKKLRRIFGYKEGGSGSRLEIRLHNEELHNM